MLSAPGYSTTDGLSHDLYVSDHLPKHINHLASLHFISLFVRVLWERGSVGSLVEVKINNVHCSLLIHQVICSVMEAYQIAQA